MTYRVIVQNLLGHGELADALYIAHTDRNGKVHLVDRWSFTEVSAYEFSIERCSLKSENMTFPGEAMSGDIRDFLQACVDEAFRLGIRPKDYQDRTAEVAAKDAHLQDMRRLAKVTE